MPAISRATDRHARSFPSGPILTRIHQYVGDLVLVHIVILDVRGLGFWVDVEPNPHRDSDTAPRPRRLTSGLGARRGFSWLWSSGVLNATDQLGSRRCGEGLILGAEGVEALLLEFLQIKKGVVRALG